MEAIQLALPTLATIALGAALLMPLRDDRPVRRFTVDTRSAEAPSPDDRRNTAELGDAHDTRRKFTTVAKAERDRVANASPARSKHIAPHPARMAWQRLLRALRAGPHATEPAASMPLTAKLKSSKVAPYSPRDASASSASCDPPAISDSAERTITEPIVDAEAKSSNALANATFAEQVAALIPESANAIAQSDAFRAPAASSREAAATLSVPATSVLDASLQPSQAHVAPLVIRSERPAFERVVPITRLPLRSQTNIITWCVTRDPEREVTTRSARHSLLTAMARAERETSADILTTAYREEDAAGRLLAMRALMRCDAARGLPIFCEALRDGTDDERSLAIDALIAIDARDALVPALADRIDAIAAKAALAYVGTNVRADYRLALEPFLDDARADALIALLAGFLE